VTERILPQPVSSDPALCGHVFVPGEPRCRACLVLKTPVQLALELETYHNLHKAALAEVPAYKHYVARLRRRGGK
jgi:hypothetical protein